MNDDEKQNLHSSTVLKELSDIKANLAVNSNETANIKASIAEIKEDIKGIRSEAVGRVEFTSAQADIKRTTVDHENRLRRLELWGGIAIGFMYALQFYFNFVKK